MEINNELIKMNTYLPVKLATLSNYNQEAALRILQEWGEGKKPLIVLWEEVNKELELLESA